MCTAPATRYVASLRKNRRCVPPRRYFDSNASERPAKTSLVFPFHAMLIQELSNSFVKLEYVIQAITPVIYYSHSVFIWSSILVARFRKRCHNARYTVSDGRAYEQAKGGCYARDCIRDYYDRRRSELRDIAHCRVCPDKAYPPRYPSIGDVPTAQINRGKILWR
jgi:hypothetical protein